MSAASDAVERLKQFDLKNIDTQFWNDIRLLRDMATKIETVARKHNNPGVNIGAHTLANQIVAIIEDRTA